MQILCNSLLILIFKFSSRAWMLENYNKRKNISYLTKDDVNRIDNIWKRCLCSIPWFNILEKGESKWIPRDPNPWVIVIDWLLAAMLTTNDNLCTLQEFNFLMSLHVLIASSDSFCYEISQISEKIWFRLRRRLGDKPLKENHSRNFFLDVSSISCFLWNLLNSSV